MLNFKKQNNISKNTNELNMKCIINWWPHSKTCDRLLTLIGKDSPELEKPFEIYIVPLKENSSSQCIELKEPAPANEKVTPLETSVFFPLKGIL